MGCEISMQMYKKKYEKESKYIFKSIRFCSEAYFCIPQKGWLKGKILAKQNFLEEVEPHNG